MRRTQVPRNAWWQFHNKSLCCSYKSLLRSYVEMHKTWPNQHNMTKLQSNMANVHFFPSMSMGFTNCSSVLNLTRTIVGLLDLSGSAQLIQNVHTSYLIPPKRTCHVFHVFQNVYTICFIPPKCVYHFYYSSKMCIPGLLFLQNVHTSSFINPKCEVTVKPFILACPLFSRVSRLPY